MSDLYRHTRNDKIDGWAYSPDELDPPWRRATFYEDIWYRLFRDRFSLAEALWLILIPLAVIAIPGDQPWYVAVPIFIFGWIVFGFLRAWSKP